MPQQPVNIDEIYLAAVELPSGAERAAFLDQACAGNPDQRQRVERLLRAQPHVDHFLESFAPPFGPTATVPPSAEALGTSIGPYKLREVLGEGGMGIVYAAEQEQPLRRKVALKLIKPGMDSREVIARMEVERQALALLDHPNIAKVFDAGTTDSGRPYFVMELVRGMPITEYCDRAKLNLRDRLKLFIAVCQAVQHAHQKGIIHRDLKPSNVMITLHDGRPVPKVIDFGVAKALNQRLTEQTLYTKVNSLVGTPMYMSPEQAELSGLDIDTRSDVYSLGVLLYELLTGQTPFDKKAFARIAYDEMRRMIREDEPLRPSQRISTLDAAGISTISSQRSIDERQLARSLRGELDWIVMKGLEKDRARRYGSADALADEVERYLQDEPVEACPPSSAYRLRKFLGRNKTVVVTTGLVALAFLTGTAVSVWQAMEATQARRLAEANLQTALNAVDQMLTRVADGKLGHIRGAELVRKELLEQALQFYEEFLKQRSDDSRLQFEVAKAWQRVGLIKNLLCDWSGSAQALDRAITIADDRLREFPDDIEYLELLAASCAKQGNALHMAEPGPRMTEILRRGLAAIARLQQLIPISREHQRINAEIQMSLGELFMYAGEDQKSIELLRSALDIHRQIFEDDGQRYGDQAHLMWNLLMLGEVLTRRDFDQGDRFLEETDELGCSLPPADQIGAPDTIYGDPHEALAIALTIRAKLHLQHKRETWAEQEVWLRRAMTIFTAHFAAHPTAVRMRQTWAEVMLGSAERLANANRTDDAERLYRDICQQLLVDYKHDYHYQVREGIEQLTAILQKSGRQDDEELAKLRFQFYENLDAFPMNSEILKRRAAFRFELRKYREALADLAVAVEENPGDTSNLTWIPPAAIAACPDESFRTGLLALAEETIQRTNGSGAAHVARGQLYAAMGDFKAARRDLDSAAFELTTADNAKMLNNSAWQIVTSEALAFRQALQALHWAEQAVELAPDTAAYWNTLGVARFRHSDWTGALVALQKSMELSSEDQGSFDWFFLAMTQRQLGHHDEAMRWYDKAVAWMEKKQPRNPELQRFRTEAAELLGISANPDEPADAETNAADGKP